MDVSGIGHDADKFAEALTEGKANSGHLSNQQANKIKNEIL